jgi:hypothetical protein
VACHRADPGHQRRAIEVNIGAALLIAAATIAADSTQHGQTIDLQDLPNLYPSQMPRVAPMVLVNKEVKEIALTPKRQGT